MQDFTKRSKTACVSFPNITVSSCPSCSIWKTSVYAAIRASDLSAGPRISNCHRPNCPISNGWKLSASWPVAASRLQATFLHLKRAFTARSDTFTLPNKKAAYELTHLVFYLSEYGRRDPQLDPQASRSLHFAGLLAYIEQNADLLSEICIAMQFARETPPTLWTEWLKRETALFTVTDGDTVALNDDYHEFLVCNWHQATIGDQAFVKGFVLGRMRFDHSTSRATPMREMSEAMFNLADARSGDWGAMRMQMQDALSPEAMDVLAQAETSSQHFEEFFHGFARAERPTQLS